MRISLRVRRILPGVCGRNQGIGGRKCGVPLNTDGVWAGLNGRSHAFRGFPKSEVWGGNRDLSIETTPGGNDVARIKLH